jgi:hypothetical protein
MMPLTDAPGGLPLPGMFLIGNYRKDDVTMNLAGKRCVIIGGALIYRKRADQPKHGGQPRLVDEQSHARG